MTVIPLSLQRWLATLSPPAHAALCAVAAAILFSGMSAFIRAANQQIDPLEIVFFRNALSVLLTWPWVVRYYPVLFEWHRVKFYGLRSLLSVGGMISGFTAVTMLPLTEATALTFTSPLFATILAAIVLREVVRARRWTAIVIGFLGTMLVLRPGVEAISIGALIALANAFLQAINTLVVKQLSRTEPTEAIITIMVLLLTPMSLIPALFVWVWPSWETLGYLFGLAVLGTVGHYFWTRAFAYGDVSLVLPFDFARLPFTAAIAWVAFGEVPLVWTWIGGATIFASTFYIAMREAALARARQLKESR